MFFFKAKYVDYILAILIKNLHIRYPESERSDFRRDTNRVSTLTVREISEADDGILKVRCTVNYKTGDESATFGGSVVSPGMTLRVAKLTSATVSNVAPSVGDSFTITCIASAETQPDFTLKRRYRYLRIRDYFWMPTEMRVVAEGSVFTATQELTAKYATVDLGGTEGISIYCQVRFVVYF